MQVREWGPEYTGEVVQLLPSAASPSMSNMPSCNLSYHSLDMPSQGWALPLRHSPFDQVMLAATYVVVVLCGATISNAFLVLQVIWCRALGLH